MSFGERRYRRYFENADYGKFINAIYDIVNKMFGFMPSAIFRYEIGKQLTKQLIFMQESNYGKNICG